MQIETKKRYASREILPASIGDTIAQRGKFRQSFSNVLSGVVNVVKPGYEVATPEMRALDRKIWLKQTTEELKDNPIEADKCAQNIAFSTVHVAILNGRDMRTDRYYTTGEAMTDESQFYFNSKSTQAQNERIQLYARLKDEGMPPTEILEHLIAFNDGLPQRLKDMAYW